MAPASARTRAAKSGGAGSLDSVRAALAERLQARRSELEEAVIARFRDVGFDPAAGEDFEYIAGARAAVAEAVDYGLVAIEQGDEWFGSGPPPIPPAAVAQARRAAAHGVSLERVLLRYNAGHTLLEDFVMQEAEHGDFSSNRIALRHVLRALGGLLDHFTSSIAGEYQDEARRMAHSPELRRNERVQRLLAGAPVDAAEIDYKFDAEHLGLIAMGPRASETARSLAAGLGCELLSVSRSKETVWAWLGSQRKITFADIERLLSAEKAEGVSLAIGGPGRGIDGWRLTHRQAQAAMLVALRRPQPLTRYADVALLATALRDDTLAQSLREIYLAPLGSEKDGAVSRKTLRAYFAAGRNAATAAAALNVDRHTVERRLHSIETRLGRLLPTCHAELEVALRLEELGDDAETAGAQSAPLS